MGYILQKYNGLATRHTCPACLGKKKFTLYVDRETGAILDPTVGRCDREINCGYHKKPKDFWSEKGMIIPKPKSVIQAVKSQLLPCSYIDDQIMLSSLRGYENNHLVQFLKAQPGSEYVDEVIQRYFIGTSKHWPGSTVFWQIDQKGKIRTGKVMDYNPVTGHRIKIPFARITWVHSLLPITNFNLNQCFFGEHLLSTNQQFPVYIVESEKTAIMASIAISNVFWLATGGKNGCKWTTPEINNVLQGRNVTLWPDLGAYEDWSKKAQIMQKQGINVQVSDLLEKIASPEQRLQGLDIADFIHQRNHQSLLIGEKYK